MVNQFFRHCSNSIACHFSWALLVWHSTSWHHLTNKKITKVDNRGKFIIHTTWGRFHEYCQTRYTVILSRIWQKPHQIIGFPILLNKYTWQHSKKTFTDIIKIVAHLLLILTWYAPRSKNMENVACRDLSRISMNIIVRSPETIFFGGNNIFLSRMH